MTDSASVANRRHPFRRMSTNISKFFTSSRRRNMPMFNNLRTDASGAAAGFSGGNNSTTSPAKSASNTTRKKSSTSTPASSSLMSSSASASTAHPVTTAASSASTYTVPPVATSASTSANATAAVSDETYPEIKGRVESKLMSMWHNVKYGWSGQLRANFSKEQPVWLLGRCYHPKYSPASSMESSAEMTASMENRLSLADYPPLPTMSASMTTTTIPSTTRAEAVTAPNAGTILPAVQVENATTSYEANDGGDDDSIEEATEFATDAAVEVGELLAIDAVGGGGGIRWEEGIEGFRRDFSSRLWMTYRREFPLLNGSTYTSDCGWGCMLRSGQMLLAQAMICHFLGRGWRWDPESQLHSTHEDQIHRKIVRWFGDTPSKNSPFSIHTLVSLGAEAGKKPGDWYGPASVSYLMKRAVKLASQENSDFDNIHVYVAQDSMVYVQDILDECVVPDPWATLPWRSTAVREVPNEFVWKALVLLVPLRLGFEKLNATYGNCLKTLLSTEHCIGIIGGRPKHSLYFVGFQEDKLIHLDPHYCQDMVDTNQENFSTSTFHCKSPRKLKLNKLDPSCCIGFYCQTRADFDRCVATVEPYLKPVQVSQLMTTSLDGCLTSASSKGDFSPHGSGNRCSYPMFSFSQSRSSDQHMHDSIRSEAMREKMSMAGGGNGVVDGDDETEEFVIL